MTFFQAPISVLTPDSNGDLVDVTGFEFAWSLADGTAVIKADAVTGGSVLRTDDELTAGETPDPAVEREVKGLDQILANLTQSLRITRRLYYDADTDTWTPAGAQTFFNDMLSYRQQVKTRRDNVASNIQWPADSLRGVLLANGEKPERLRIG